MRQIGLLLLSLFFISPVCAYAQTVQSALGAGTDITFIPQVPGPNQQVRATLESSAINLDAASINWMVNGVSRLSGRGEKALTFTTGDIGSRMTVSASIDSPQGRVTSSRVIEIGSVDLLWQGDGYAHPFYKGKTLWSNQTYVNFLAIPNAPTASLVYRWSLDGEVVGSSSGVGKNFFSIGDSLLNLPRTVAVEVMSGQNVIARNSVTLKPSSPELLIYELHPLYGYMFNREVRNGYDMNAEEVTLSAFPMFFSSSSRDNALIKYEWRTSTGGVDASKTVTYRTESKDPINSQISIKASHLEKFLQTASKGFALRFNQER